MRIKPIWFSLCITTLLIPTVVRAYCNSDQFTCKNGDCTSKSFQCDGGRDCSDESDEDNCVCTNGPSCYREPISTCKINEFRCTSGACIPSNWQCDGDYDCADLSDEQCEQRTCEQFQFTCDNGVCIDVQLKCNTRNDCGDNSDETICQIHTTNSAGTNLTDCGDAYRCKDGSCIPLIKVCDLNKDCSDGSDEDNECFTIPCSLAECDQDFQKTPSGCQCKCHKGYRLAGDGITCIDMLECSQEPPVCSQLCTETEGSYHCGCFKEFSMRYDNITCKSKGHPMSIYYAVGNEIRQYIPARRNLHIVHFETAGELKTLDLDIANEIFYYSVKTNSSLYQLSVKNLTKKSISNVGEASSIALDWITGNIYLFSNVESNNQKEETVQNSHYISYSLKVCHMISRNCALLSEPIYNASSLVVDPINKLLFYSSINIHSDEVELIRVGLDGALHQRIARFTSIVTNIAIDYRQKVVYVARESVIEKVNYDGSHLMTILETSMHIEGLNIFEDQLYFLTDFGLTMHKCRLFGDARRCTSFRLSADTTDMFVIAQLTRQTPGRNVCVNYDCEHICLPNQIGASCVCEDGRVVDELSNC